MDTHSNTNVGQDQHSRLGAGNPSRLLSLWDLLAILRRWIFLILSVGFLCLAATVYLLTQTTPTYTGYGQILLGDQGLSDQSTFDLIEAQAVTSSLIEGEIAILRSNEFLARVVRELKLDEDPEFNFRLAEVSPPNPAVVWLKDQVKKALGMTRENETVAPPATPSVSQEILEASSANERSMGEIGNVVGVLRSGLFIRQQGNSFILSIQMTSENPKKAAAISNTVMDQYISFLVDKRFQAARRFTSWLEVRVEELAEKLEASEREALAFRAIMEADADSSVRLEQQMRELTTKLVNARAELAEAEARARRAKEIYEADGALATANILANDTIRQYRVNLSELRQEKVAASRSFSADSQQLQSIERGIDKTEIDIIAEVENLLLQLTNSVEILSINATALEGSLRSFEGLNMQRSNEQIRLNQLQRVADANRKIYEGFLERYKESSEILNLQTSDADVISYASPPSVPSYPRKTVASVLSLLGGLGIGTALALLLEVRAKKISSTRQLAVETGMTVYGSVPRIGKRTSASGMLSALVQSPNSRLAHAGMNLENNINLHNDESIRAVFVTSYDDNVGKPLTAALVAWAAVKSGKTCVLVDGDFRTATLSNDFKVALNSSFLSAVYGARPLQDCIVKDLGFGFDFIGTQRAVVEPSVIYNADQTQEILTQLKTAYDVVIIAAPTLEIDSDSFVTNNSPDLGIFTIPARKVLLRNISKGLTTFENLNLRDTGLVLTGKN